LANQKSVLWLFLVGDKVAVTAADEEGMDEYAAPANEARRFRAYAARSRAPRVSSAPRSARDARPSAQSARAEPEQATSFRNVSFPEPKPRLGS